MNLLRISLAVFAVFFFVSSAVPGYASSKPEQLPPPDENTVIRSVDTPDNSVQIVNHRDHDNLHTYKIDDITKIMVNGSPGKFTSIKAGMIVTDIVERDDQTLDSLTLSGYDTPAKPKSTKPKKKSSN